MGRKLNYNEGTCFVVPLRGRGFARGLVARMNGKGIVFGYFFGPRILSAQDPLIAKMPGYRQAIMSGQFGDLGLLNGEWQLKCRIENWNRDDWPLPPFAKVDDQTGRVTLSYYDENTLAFVREERGDLSDVDKYPKDVLMGYGAVEIRLDSLLE